MTKPIKAWHFTPSNHRLRYGDDREIVYGETLTVACEPVLCESGLHGSRDILDALGCAPGPWVDRVEIGGTIIEGEHKLCGTERTALWGCDATDVLRRFARCCALDVIHLWDAPGVVRCYLETGDESLRAPAWEAAACGARGAQEAARGARTAAWAAVCGARTAAWAAAWEAQEAARAAARGAQEAAQEAARGAQEAAREAQEAVRKRQSRRLVAMICARKRRHA